MVNFNQYLEEHKNIQWTENYVNYYYLKTLIKNTNFSEFDTQLKNELEKVANFYDKEVLKISDTEDINTCFDNADTLRQYVILNVIGFIKIIKKRNKNVESSGVHFDIINTKDLLDKYTFYKCFKLRDIFNDILEDAVNENTQMLIKHFEDSNSFRLVKNYYNFQPSFSSFSDVPFCNTDFIKNYLSEKIGETDALPVINEILEIEHVCTDANDTKLEQVIKQTHDAPLEEVPNNIKCQRYFILVASLYSFLFGLGLMGDSFKAISGRSVGYFFNYISNPIAGVMIGIIATVLLQSSSTSTSIVVSMVGADIIDVPRAIPVIMGANIGTSVTNTIVSQGHIRNVDEFKRAFSGATVHDLFNLLTVALLLPLNVITGALGYPFFENFSESVTSVFADVKAGTFKSPIKIIVSPLTKMFLKVDKDVIKEYAQGCIECESNSTEITNYCWDFEKENCLSYDIWNSELESKDIIASGLFKKFGSSGGIIGIIFSLFVLCVAIYFLIKTLQRVILGGNQNCLLRSLRKVLNRSPYIAMLFGMGLTIMVQSSSITTSTFTPLVGLEIITLEQMFPLTLGANIGTTCTAALAALVSGKVNAIQIAFCHFFFNIFGIMIWYPVSAMREVPLRGARQLGNYIVKYKWFGFFYLLYVFMLMPLVLWFVSFLFNYNTFAGTFFGSVFTISIMGGSVFMFYNFDSILQKTEKCLQP